MPDGKHSCVCISPFSYSTLELLTLGIKATLATLFIAQISVRLLQERAHRKAGWGGGGLCPFRFQPLPHSSHHSMEMLEFLLI